MTYFFRKKGMAIKTAFFNDAGNAAIEFVLVVPILMALIFTLVDMSRIIITDSILQSVVGELSSDYRTLSSESRSLVSENSVWQNLSQIVEASGRGWIDMERLDLQIVADDVQPSAGYVGAPSQQMTYEMEYSMSSSAPFVYYFLDEAFFQRKVRLSVRNVGMSRG